MVGNQSARANENEGDEDLQGPVHLAVAVQHISILLEKLNSLVSIELVSVWVVITCSRLAWQDQSGSNDGSSFRSSNHVEDLGHRDSLGFSLGDAHVSSGDVVGVLFHVAHEVGCYQTPVLSRVE